MPSSGWTKPWCAPSSSRVTSCRLRCSAAPFRTCSMDVMCSACAQTGTGKTAAFVLPMLQRLAARRAVAARHAQRSRRSPWLVAARARRGTHARARRADRRAGDRVRTVSLSAHRPRRHLWRRRAGLAGARAARASGDPRGDARSLARSDRSRARSSRRRGDPGPRRGRPHARHGLSARREAHRATHAALAADAALLGDHPHVHPRARRGLPHAIRSSSRSPSSRRRRRR